MSLLALNSGAAGQGFSPPEILSGRLYQDDRSWPVVLKSVVAEGQIVGHGGFASKPYSLALPDGVTGRLILEISRGLPGALRAVISISVTGEGQFASHPPDDSPVPIAGPSTVASTLQRSFVDHFTALDPIYFIYGPKAPAAKFQFSFKYRLLLFEGGGRGSPETTLQFGYTQRSLWDINASSSPFYDTSYMPSLFFQYLTAAPRRDDQKGGATWLRLQTGYQHESNGQGSVESRSLNTLFVRSGFLLGRPDRWHAIAQARVFDYVGGLSDNPDLKDYRGYGDWQLIFARGNGPSLSYTGRAGKDFDHFTSQFDLTFPLRTKVLDFATYFLIQYFNGYGESLRDYNRYSDTIRAGVSLVR